MNSCVNGLTKFRVRSRVAGDILSPYDAYNVLNPKRLKRHSRTFFRNAEISDVPPLREQPEKSGLCTYLGFQGIVSHVMDRKGGMQPGPGTRAVGANTSEDVLCGRVFGSGEENSKIWHRAKFEAVRIQ